MHKIIPSRPTFNDLIDEVKIYKREPLLGNFYQNELSYLLFKARWCEYCCVIPSKLCHLFTKIGFYVLTLIFLSSFIFTHNIPVETNFYITLGLNIFSKVILHNVNYWKNEEREIHKEVIELARINLFLKQQKG